MSSGEAVITMRFSGLEAQATDFDDPSSVLLGVVANFEILIGERLLFAEADFPVLEFARSAHIWLSDEDHGTSNFEYDSAESAESGLVWFRREGSGWRVGSLFQEYPATRTFSLDEIEQTVERFIQNLTQECRSHLGLDPSMYLTAV